ncbi:ABC transporter ATP-binding protein [Deinococcus metallilatus]|uniref:ABC transporter ATP-binding protein n=1 Tax=Deinococcus metallilatus TaxID=1211322 RepID=A0AAJ5F154_9DEIO|nr:ABC transporter ATP-binding protein [Deinococcus metallilatus]MBB5296629.1 ABC-2 type transport system ATP-binding protein [Deinococcus metallilatus]QBY08353.1 ABC transporter ATP-binding protein [Deinococcus metallilatus]RXJ11152.1 ABC transporter ATP-binding protein [Deinococcus metallilatus]TLK24643.1 ABC transporter ATP-binding protein [Deinococcus metallilatus]
MTALPPGPPALELRDLGKHFGGREVVAGVSLSVPAGELYALLGPNGAGKTTTLRMISGLTRPDRGEVLIYGFNMQRQAREAKQRLAYLPDDPLLYGKLTPPEYLEFVAGLWGIDAARAAPRAEELLHWLNLWPHRTERVEGFSRGMKQKLALAGALVHEPRLMLLDEPLTGLDAAAARQVKDALRAFVEGGGAVVLTTHILEVAERLSDRIGIIAAGRLVAEGTPAELLARTGTTSLEDAFLHLTGLEATPAGPLQEVR